MKRVAIVGASVGGLVAAAELKSKGFDVTIFEAGARAAGMYGRVKTPFGMQELGMHVLYLTEQHFDHLSSIFGADSFHFWTGAAVDVAASRNFGCNFFDSAYPDIRGQPLKNTIREQVLNTKREGYLPQNALEAVLGRFGEEAGRNVYAPILKKLWGAEPELLSRDAIQCFFDLRRIILCDKEEADRIKEDPWLDTIIGNPIQSQPHAEVFGGRLAARFKNSSDDLDIRVRSWLQRSGVNLEFDKAVEVIDGRLMVSKTPIDENFDACIVATPVATIFPELKENLESQELSIFYFHLDKSLGGKFPAYYILLHESHLRSSRIVNYDAYSAESIENRQTVLAVEVVHPIGRRPTVESVIREVLEVFPMASINEHYTFPYSLMIPTPSLRNGQLIDTALKSLKNCFDNDALYFTGMRTDKGIFFSHHTIGLSHEAALDCTRRLSGN